MAIDFYLSFNTQPPEGGWIPYPETRHDRMGFNTQPPEGGWSNIFKIILVKILVSTHSRPKAAGAIEQFDTPDYMFQHTAARRRLEAVVSQIKPEAEFQHTAARRRLAGELAKMTLKWRFQHTAARRRLDGRLLYESLYLRVSTHSRPKAAGSLTEDEREARIVSTHSRPKAAGHGTFLGTNGIKFQHTAARRRLARAL